MGSFNETCALSNHNISPGTPVLATHIIAAGKDFPAKDELLQSCAELARIEWIMANSHQPWYIPPLGGQDGGWALRVRLLSLLLTIAEKQEEEWEKEYDD